MLGWAGMAACFVDWFLQSFYSLYASNRSRLVTGAAGGVGIPTAVVGTLGWLLRLAGR
jgi:hypothetical protein